MKILPHIESQYTRLKGNCVINLIIRPWKSHVVIHQQSCVLNAISYLKNKLHSSQGYFLPIWWCLVNCSSLYSGNHNWYKDIFFSHVWVDVYTEIDILSKLSNCIPHKYITSQCEMAFAIHSAHAHMFTMSIDCWWFLQSMCCDEWSTGGKRPKRNLSKLDTNGYSIYINSNIIINLYLQAISMLPIVFFSVSGTPVSIKERDTLC